MFNLFIDNNHPFNFQIYHFPSGKKVIEFDGPTHYRKDEPTIETNKSKTKKDILKQAGFEVIVISYLDMSNNGGKIKLDQSYIKKILKLE